MDDVWSPHPSTPCGTLLYGLPFQHCGELDALNDLPLKRLNSLGENIKNKLFFWNAWMGHKERISTKPHNEVEAESAKASFHLKFGNNLVYFDGLQGKRRQEEDLNLTKPRINLRPQECLSHEGKHVRCPLFRRRRGGDVLALLNPGFGCRKGIELTWDFATMS